MVGSSSNPATDDSTIPNPAPTPGPKPEKRNTTFKLTTRNNNTTNGDVGTSRESSTNEFVLDTQGRIVPSSSSASIFEYDADEQILWYIEGKIRNCVSISMSTSGFTHVVGPSNVSSCRGLEMIRTSVELEPVVDIDESMTMDEPAPNYDTHDGGNGGIKDEDEDDDEDEDEEEDDDDDGEEVIFKETLYQRYIGFVDDGPWYWASISSSINWEPTIFTKTTIPLI
jgi:hypothetical protein